MSEEDKHRMIFEEAIRFETDGREFFLNAAEKSRNPFTKTVFQMIAEEERDHIKKIQQFFKSYSVSEKEEIPLGMKEENLLQNVFRQAIDQMDQSVIVDADEMKAIRLAIQLEIKGHEFYDRLAKEATDDFEKVFYRYLAQAEDIHFSVLRQMEEAVMSQKTFG
jgi:rubrerythrin